MTRSLVRVLLAAVGSCLIALFCFLVLHSNATIAALFLLLGVVLAGAYAARAEAIAASIAATLCLDYFFIPPIGRISIGDPEGWLALGVFLTVSIVATNLSMRLRRQRDEMAESQAATEKLHALNRAVLLSDGGSEGVQRLLVNKCIELFGFEEAALFESATASVYRSQPEGGAIGETEMRRAANYGAVQTAGRVTVMPITLGNQIYGSFAYVGGALSAELMNGLGNAIAVSLAQGQAQRSASRAEAVRRSEELKSVIIDALAHELKTPLTAIEAAAEMLYGGKVSGEQQADMIEVVRQETQRLQRLMEEAIHLARIEAKRFKLERAAAPVDTLIQKAIRAVGQRAASHPIHIEAGERPATVYSDGELIVEVIKQLLDNALKYSAEGKPITITVEEENGLASITVQDQGPGLTELEQGRIFDKFYRAKRDHQGVPGTGMGLAIAREIAEAHGGAVRVESQLGAGSRFTLTLPVLAATPREAQAAP